MQFDHQESILVYSSIDLRVTTPTNTYERSWVNMIPHLLYLGRSEIVNASEMVWAEVAYSPNLFTSLRLPWLDEALVDRLFCTSRRLVQKSACSNVIEERRLTASSSMLLPAPAPDHKMLFLMSVAGIGILCQWVLFA